MMFQTKLRPFIAITKKLTVRNIFKNITTSESKKAVTLYAAQAFGLVFSFVAQKLNTKYLVSPEEYGIVTGSLAIFTFLYTIFEFGVFSSGARMLARAKTEKEMRQVWGILCVFVGFISISFSIVIGLAAIFFDFLLPVAGMKEVLLTTSLLAWVFPLQYFFQETIPGSQKMYQLSTYTIFSKFLYAGGLFIAIKMLQLNSSISLILNLSSMAISGCITILLLKPIFRGWKSKIPDLKRELKEYGTHVYIGRLFSLPAFNLAGMLVPLLGGTAASAFFSIGGNITTPMVQASQAISSTLYKNFLMQKRLKYRLIVINGGVLCIIGLTIYFGAPAIIRLAASEKYYAAIPLMFPLVLAGLFQGLYQPLNIFVSAHGRGKWMRQVSTAGAVFDTASCLILIPIFGVVGACWQSVASRIFWLLLCWYNYRRTVRYLAKNQ